MTVQIVSVLYLLAVIGALLAGKEHTGCMSKDNTKAAKGLLALSIILCHLTSHTNFHLPGFSFSAMGAIGVGAFFFLSGFGLVQASKQHFFFERYLSNHAEKILIPYLLMLVIWLAVFHIVFHEELRSFINSFIGGNPVSNSWYVFASLFCYVLYWGAFKGDGRYGITIILIGLAAWIFLTGYILRWNGWWWRTICCFFIGILWGLHYEILRRRIKAHRSICLLVAAMFMTVSYLCPSILSRFLPGKAVWIINDVSMGIGGAVLIGVLSECFDLQNPMTDYLGKISYEIYLYHGLIIKLFENLLKESIQSQTRAVQEIIAIVIVFATIAVAAPMHRLSGNLFRMIRTRRQAHARG